MHTTEELGRQRRRRHSEAFKAESIAACCQPGVSIAAVALSRRLNANLLRRWVADAEQAGRHRRGGGAVTRSLSAPIVASNDFIPLKMSAAATGSSSRAEAIQVDVRRGALTVTVRWPSAAGESCGQWLRELVRG